MASMPTRTSLSRRRQDEAGQALPLVALLMLAVGAAALLLGQVAGSINDGARAQTAADAIALAVVEAGPPVAPVVAGANEATIEHLEVTATGATVTARVGQRVARARAQLEGGLPMAGE